MPETITDWLQFDATQPRKQRAEAVCVGCHTKKVKCDLQARNLQGYQSCTNCNSSDKACHLRPSRRSKRRHVLGPQNKPAKALTPQPGLPDGPADVPSPHQADLVLDTICVPSPEGFHESVVSWAQPGNTTPLEHPLPPPSLHRALYPETSPSQRSRNSANSHTELISGSQRSDIDTGFLQVYGPENELDAQRQTIEACFQQNYSIVDPQQQDLVESFAETYWEYCYPWCPVLDPDSLGDEVARSPLLANALALAGSHVRPPLVPHPGPAEYYKRARAIFYNDEEMDSLTALKAIALFYWWAPRPPSIVHRHSSWWWTSVLIRHAQQMNFHRELAADESMKASLCLSVRRRIWWTAFARERLTALCQSKPTIIDPDDCNIEEPSLADFPNDLRSQRKGQVFIYWVRLCAIIGRVAKVLARPDNVTNAAAATTPNHKQELLDWITSLPPQLRLPIGSSRTKELDRDVHQLHLPYLTTIIILHLNRSAYSLPEALPPAILAASCISRILRDILSRGDTRFLMAITSWYCGTAFIPLLQASRIPQISKDANECLDVLQRAIQQLQAMWASANVIRQGFERLRNTGNAPSSPAVPTELSTTHSQEATKGVSSDPEDLNNYQGAEAFDWTLLFPFVTRQTDSIANCLLEKREQGAHGPVLPAGAPSFRDTLMTQFDNLLEPWPDLRMDFMSSPL